MALSEGVTILTRSHSGPGILVHREAVGRFVSLYRVPALQLEGAGETKMDDVPQTLRVSMGTRAVALSLTCHGENSHLILKNVWMEAGEEMWISTNHTNTSCVYGVCSKRIISL